MANGEKWTRIGALWKKEKGFSGTIQLDEAGPTYRIWASKNRYKKASNNQPDVHIFLMPERQRQRPKPQPQRRDEPNEYQEQYKGDVVVDDDDIPF